MDIWAVVVESIRLGIGPQAAAYAVAALLMLWLARAR